MHEPGDHPQFEVAAHGEDFKVVDAEGKTFVVCQDAANANQYAGLMNQSFQRGYKAGYRHAKKLSR